MKNVIIHSDALEGLKSLPDNYINTCVTSPPYWGLRDYGASGQIGLERTPEAFIKNLVAIFREVKRALRNDGTIWINIGDSYAGSGRGVGDTKKTSKMQRNHSASYVGDISPVFTSDDYKPKDLVGAPWMLAFALRSDGWYLRSDIIWHKPNPMPESVTDRPTKAHEYIFLLSKSNRYYYDADSIKTKMLCVEQDKRCRPGRKRAPTGKINGIREGNNSYYEFANKRSVWSVTTQPFEGSHFATFPEELIVDCIKAGSPEGGIVLDPFMGAGTTAVVAQKLNRNYIGFELNEKYIRIAKKRLHNEIGIFNQ